MVRFEQCEICGTPIEIEGNEPRRCKAHTKHQIELKQKRDLELDTVDYLINKYGYSPAGF